MEVYLVPVGRGQYELYCEVEAAAPQVSASHGWWQRILDRFRAVLKAVENEEHRHHEVPAAQGGAPPGPGTRLKRRALRWMAERLAEQRLLWHLRNADRALAVHPDDLDGPTALDRIRKMLAHDLQRHRLWLIVNAVAFVASGVVMPLPGPNILAYYFAFRLVGHFLSMRGAGNGLAEVEWSLRPNDALTALRLAAAMDAPARTRHVQEIAARLGLRGLPRFYGRTGLTTS
ncbi:MAG: hypothetical protein IMZ55_11450 [Acidobacteria bacterium]|nr:hypothetical protein [Planctomycetota bacterium]MBE3134082.1 hypothetical protein [Acidobacteriota bacterium]